MPIVCNNVISVRGEPVVFHESGRTKKQPQFTKKYPQANNRERKLKLCWQKRKLEEADQITFLSSRNNNNNSTVVKK